MNSTGVASAFSGSFTRTEVESIASALSANFSLIAAASRAFDLLAEPVRKWVYDQGWQTLRDAQEAAIPLLLEGAADVIIAAATAAGKTEAAFLPICSRLAAGPAQRRSSRNRPVNPSTVLRPATQPRPGTDRRGLALSSPPG